MEYDRDPQNQANRSQLIYDVLVYRGTSLFNGDVLHNLGKIVEGLDNKDVANIPESVIEENLHIFAEATLEPAIARTILEKTESSKRGRRAAGQGEGLSINCME